MTFSYNTQILVYVFGDFAGLGHSLLQLLPFTSCFEDLPFQHALNIVQNEINFKPCVLIQF